jgi:hypothetical protein
MSAEVLGRTVAHAHAHRLVSALALLKGIHKRTQAGDTKARKLVDATPKLTSAWRAGQNV